MTRPTEHEVKMAWGFLYLLIVGGLIARIALGQVVQATSYGLTEMIAVIGPLGGMWAQWAFSNKIDKDKPTDADMAEFRKWMAERDKQAA